ncbi:MAG: RNA polymerase sigma factor [Cyclobacteriaceae bacterium]
MPSAFDLINEFLETRSEQVFRLIYRELTPQLYRMALRLSGDEAEAQDAVQETWLRAVSQLDTFKGKSQFKSWLVGILINCCREKFRQQRDVSDIDDVIEIRSVETKIDSIDLENALNKMPYGYKEVLLLHDLEGYKHHEIGEMLGIAEGTSKSQLFNARKAMRKLLLEKV